MLCKDNMASLDYKSKINNAKHIFPSSPPPPFLIKGITKTTYHEMHECYAMQILKTKNKRAKGEWSQRILR